MAKGRETSETDNETQRMPSHIIKEGTQSGRYSKVMTEYIANNGTNLNQSRFERKLSLVFIFLFEGGPY